MIRKKVHKRCKNFSKNFSSNCSHGEVGSSLKVPLTFFGQPAETIPLEIQGKDQFVGFAKDLHPKVSIEIENPVLTTPLLFLRDLLKKSAQCPKMKKKKQNCSSLKCYLGHVECSLNIPVEKLEKKPETSSSLSKNDENFHLFSKTVFFQNDFIDTKNAVLTGRQNFSCSITGNDWKKVHKKCKNFSKNLLQKVTKEK